eukprot:6209930-Pleurochrysis_carterae.AAC.1
MYHITEPTGEIRQIACPDADAGLYVRGRQGQLARVVIPASHIGFQIGETAQIHSGGLLQVTLRARPNLVFTSLVSLRTSSRIRHLCLKRCRD